MTQNANQQPVREFKVAGLQVAVWKGSVVVDEDDDRRENKERHQRADVQLLHPGSQAVLSVDGQGPPGR